MVVKALIDGEHIRFIAVVPTALMVSQSEPTIEPYHEFDKASFLPIFTCLGGSAGRPVSEAYAKNTDDGVGEENRNASITPLSLIQRALECRVSQYQRIVRTSSTPAFHWGPRTHR